jgi:hypothetical protein
VQAGIVDPGKLYLRLLEKMGEHPADFTSDKILSQLMSTWGNEMDFKMPDPNQKNNNGEAGAQTSNLTQSDRGVQFGNSGNQGGDKTLIPQ